MHVLRKVFFGTEVLSKKLLISFSNLDTIVYVESSSESYDLLTVA